MEISKAIRTGYFSVLDGNITHNGDVVPIYDAYAVPEEVTYPYILLSTQNNIQRVIKRCKIYDSSILIDIVTGSPEPIGRSQSEDIAYQVENLINPDGLNDIDIVSNGYRIGSTYRIADNDINSKNGVNYVFRKLLTYSHIVSKV